MLKRLSGFDNRQSRKQLNPNCSLGYTLALGEGVRQDYSEAATWYRKAAEQGQTNAQHNLEFSLHANGRGVAQDLVQAYM